VDQFKYLGSIITQDNDIKTEMRLQSANKCFFGLNKIFRSKVISKNLKVRMYLTLLRPIIILYGVETWPLKSEKDWRTKDGSAWEKSTQENVWGILWCSHKWKEEITQWWAAIPFSVTRYSERDKNKKAGLSKTYLEEARFTNKKSNNY